VDRGRLTAIHARRDCPLRCGQPAFHRSERRRPGNAYHAYL